MFSYESLYVYQRAKAYHSQIFKFLKDNKGLPTYVKSQLGRAALSIMLNIAEGSGIFTKPDKRNLYIIARGSVFECVAILDIFKDSSEISETEHSNIYQMLEKQSRMM